MRKYSILLLLACTLLWSQDVSIKEMDKKTKDENRSPGFVGKDYPSFASKISGEFLLEQHNRLKSIALGMNSKKPSDGITFENDRVTIDGRIRPELIAIDEMFGYFLTHLQREGSTKAVSNALIQRGLNPKDLDAMNEWMTSNELHTFVHFKALRLTKDNFPGILSHKARSNNKDRSRLSVQDKERVLIYYKSQRDKQHANVVASLLESVSLRSQRIIISYLYETCTLNTISRYDLVDDGELENFNALGFRSK